jgi:hypothetical protein
MINYMQQDEFTFGLLCEICGPFNRDPVYFSEVGGN